MSTYCTFLENPLFFFRKKRSDHHRQLTLLLNWILLCIKVDDIRKEADNDDCDVFDDAKELYVIRNPYYASLIMGLVNSQIKSKE